MLGFTVFIIFVDGLLWENESPNILYFKPSKTHLVGDLSPYHHRLKEWVDPLYHLIYIDII